MESALDGLSFALLLTSLFILRFRGWKRPLAVVAYFVFFLVLEIGASHFFMPPDAFGPALSILCFSLTIPVLIAAALVWRHERRHGDTE
jgi:hypothetical protein